MKLCLTCGATFAAAGWDCPACGHAPLAGEAGPVFCGDADAAEAGFKDTFFEDLHRREADNFWFRARNRLVVAILQRHFADARSLLEVGCGNGFVLAGIRQARPDLALTATDPFANALQIAHSRVPDAVILQADARTLPFDAEFDLVGAFDVLEHIERDEEALRHLHRVLRPGGGIILTVPQHAALWSPIDEYSLHKRRYSRQDLVAKMQAAGFRILQATSFVFFLVPLMLASRLVTRTSGRCDPQAEYRIPAAVGFCFERLMDLERLLITRGVRLPVGGSLLVAARRD